MDLKAIMAKCAKLRICQKRVLTEDYAELVILAKQMDKWRTVFENILGYPVKSCEDKPSKGAIDCTRKYGGIWDNQTLYKDEVNGTTVMAIFFPWNDCEHVTLKIVVSQKE